MGALVMEVSSVAGLDGRHKLFLLSLTLLPSYLMR